MKPTPRALQSPGESALYATIACMLIFALGVALPIPLAVPLIAVGIGILPFALRFMVEQPIYLCVGFVVFSFFRIHEVFPVLMPFRIPQLLAIPTLGVLFWHIVGTLRLRPFMTAELKAFLVFFMLVTLGLPFATDRPTAISYWTATYVKIGVMTFAIAWLIREQNDFMTFMRLIVLAGVSVALVAISNKLQGIGLVEGTRVTIGRDIRSVLGDPNDLSLVLLSPSVSPWAWLSDRVGLSTASGAVSRRAHHLGDHRDAESGWPARHSRSVRGHRLASCEEQVAAHRSRCGCRALPACGRGYQ